MVKRYVAFALAGARYGVSVADVAQIVRHERVQRVPRALSCVEGVITLRGEVVPVLDLRVRLGAPALAAQRRAETSAPQAVVPGSTSTPASGERASRRRILVVRHAGRTCGLAVDEVHELVDVDESAIEPLPAEGAERPAFVRAVAQSGGGALLLPELAAILDAAGAAGPEEAS